MLDKSLQKEVVRASAKVSREYLCRWWCRRVRRSLALLWISFAPAVAAGQSKDIMELSPEQLRSVQVYSASLRLQSSREAPSSVTVITAIQIQELGYRTLGDVLRSVRGFDVTYDRNYNYVGVRGFSQPGGYNDQILLLVNGHRLNDNVYNSAQIGTEFPLDIDLVERIEIVRGPSSSLYGASAFLAVINVITKSAQSLTGLQLSGEGGGFGAYRARATLGGTRRGIEGLFSGTVYDSAGPETLFFPAFDSPATNYGIAQNADHDSSRSLYGRLGFRGFTLDTLFSTREKGIPTASFGQVFNDPRSRTTDSSGHLDLRYSRTVFHDVQFTAGVYFDRALYHGVYIYAGTDSSPGDVVNQDSSRGDVVGTYARIAKTLWQKQQVSGGVEFRDNLRQDQTNYNLNPSRLVLNDQRSSQDWAVFVQDEFAIARDLIVSAGLRHDQYQTFGGTTNPRLAFIYSPRKRTTFKVVYGQAFRAPNNYELYYTDQISLEANPRLQPEKIRSEELIWEQSLGGQFRISASGFANQFVDLIQQQSDPKTGLLIFENSESVHSRGFEIELAGRTRSGIEGQISYTLQKTEDELTGLRPSDSPPQLAKAQIVLPMVRRRLTLGFELQYTDPRNTLTGSQVDGYVLSNLTVTSREFGAGFRVSGSVYNLFNTGYSDPAGAEIVGSTVRQNGRDFRVQLTRTIRR